MGIRWKEFQIPKSVAVEKETLTQSYGKFTIEPLERGFGTTFGNSLRRMLLSSIEGVAVVAMKIDGVEHEFSCIDGVLEDVPQIIMNVRKLVLRMTGSVKRVISLDISTEGVVTSGQIKTDGFVEIVFPDQYLFTLSKPTKVYIELTVARGRGFSTAQENKGEGFPIGVIPIDSVFSPIVRVNFTVEDKRVVDVTDYNKLVLDIHTNGGILPSEALNQAVAIWKKHLDLFEDVPEEEIAPVPVSAESEEEVSSSENLLPRSISDLEFSVRSSNCLKKAGIETLRDLVSRSEEEMLKYPNFGKRSLEEINSVLSTLNMSLGMDLSEIDKAASEK